MGMRERSERLPGIGAVHVQGVAYFEGLETVKKLVIFAIPLLASSSAGFVFLRFVSACDEVVGDAGVLRFVGGEDGEEGDDGALRFVGGVEGSAFDWTTSVCPSSSSSEISNTSCCSNFALPFDGPAFEAPFEVVGGLENDEEGDASFVDFESECSALVDEVLACEEICCSCACFCLLNIASIPPLRCATGRMNDGSSVPTLPTSGGT